MRGTLAREQHLLPAATRTQRVWFIQRQALKPLPLLQLTLLQAARLLQRARLTLTFLRWLRLLQMHHNVPQQQLTSPILAAAAEAGLICGTSAQGLRLRAPLPRTQQVSLMVHR